VKPLTMTEDEERAIRTASAADTSECHGCAFSWQDVAKRLLAEIDALRKLPVIVGTYECAHHDRETCRHPRRVRITCDEPLPHAVCPLRSAP